MSNCFGSTLQNVSLPGPPGTPAYTVTTAPFSVPTINATVSIFVVSTLAFTVGQDIFIGSSTQSGANFTIQSISGLNELIAEFLDIANDLAAGTVVAAQSIVTPGTGNVLAISVESGDAAYSYLTAAFNVPAIGATVSVAVNSTAPFVDGQNVFIVGGFNFKVGAVSNPTSLMLFFLGATGDSAPGSTIVSGTLILPSLGNQTGFPSVAHVSIVSGVPSFANGLASTLGTGNAPQQITYGGAASYTNTNPYNVECYLDFGAVGNVTVLDKSNPAGVSTQIFPSIASVSSVTVGLKPGEILGWFSGGAHNIILSVTPL